MAPAGRCHGAGPQTVPARTGGETCFEHTEIDLVLLDHYPPDETGLALVRRMRERGPHMDVIMVTAARGVATIQAAMRHGALHYLVKPFTFAGLRVPLEGYAALRRTLDSGGEAEQDEVDRISGVLGGASAGSSPCRRATRRRTWCGRSCGRPRDRSRPRMSPPGAD